MRSAGKRDSRHSEVIHPEPGIESHERNERAPHEARTDQEHQRERDLAANDEAAQPQAVS